MLLENSKIIFERETNHELVRIIRTEDQKYYMSKGEVTTTEITEEEADDYIACHEGKFFSE